MAANHFNRIRKSYTVSLFFTSILSNLVVFGQPIQQMVADYCQLKEEQHFYGSLTASAETDAEKEIVVSENSKISGQQTQKTVGKITLNAGASLSGVYYADEKEGNIGKLYTTDAENPYDNFFSISIPETVDLQKYRAFLVYDLYGVAAASQTTKSINNHFAYGGKAVTVTDKWTPVKENVLTRQLKTGSNEIYFNRRAEEIYQYKIKNLRIELQDINNGSGVNNAEHILTNYNGSLHVAGTIPETYVTQIEALGEKITVTEGVFEHVFKNIPENVKQVAIAYTTNKGELNEIFYPVVYKAESITHQFTETQVTADTKSYFYNDLISGVAGYEAFHADIDAEKLHSRQGQLSVTGLTFKDVKTLSNDIENVTAGNYAGYRIKRMNIPDSIPVQLHLKYNPDNIPEGYTAKDIKTFYFDKKQRSWKALPVDSLNYEKQEIISQAFDNETDYINGVITQPQSPETGSFTPTTISDMKYADPSAGIVSIQPPSPTHTGAATTSFPIKVPAGRNGIQPSLQVTYNSEAGNGLMGVGWNLSTPAISLNTKWGVPRYDSNFESEIYSFNGSDLVLVNGTTPTGDPNYTNPHREDNIPRQSQGERQFYQRKEGSYQKIIRHGNSPKNYWWEVTDKQGNKSFYGGYNGSTTYVIKSFESNIAYWPLVRVEDPYGNYMQYIYLNNDDVVAGNVVARKQFLSKIKYTLHQDSDPSTYTNANYEIEFKRNGYSVGAISYPSREDIIVTARNGFFQVTNDLLTEIRVSYVGQSEEDVTRIRTYRFDYEEKAFKKQQLVKISEYDTEDTLFYANTLEYYDTTNGGNNTIINGAASPWNAAPNDNIPTPLHNIAGSNVSIIPNGSPLGTSSSSGSSVSLRAGFGLFHDIYSVSNTVGASGSSSKNSQSTHITFIDINGDGLPDKVYKGSGGVSYRPNLGNGFGDLTPLTGISNLSKTESRTFGGGVDANAFGLIGVGKSWSKTTNNTDNYFTDFNGDGLPDIVKGGRVWFNSDNGNNVTGRFFNQDVNLSENKIVAGPVSQAIVDNLQFETMQELEAEYPQFDHVKVWRAPFDGFVNIASWAKLRAKNSYTNEQGQLQANNFKVTIEKATGDNTSSVIGKNLQTVGQQEYLNYSNLLVHKDDLIFFRIHNKDYGYGGEIEWNPEISYSIITEIGPIFNSFEDENIKDFGIYEAKGDFMMNNGMLQLDESKYYDVHFNVGANSYTANQFSDVIRFKVEKIGINLTTGERQLAGSWTKTYNPDNGSVTGILSEFGTPGDGNPDFKYSLHFYAESDSQIDWSSVEWRPVYYINQGTEQHVAPVNYQTYDDNINQEKYWVDSSQLIDPNIQDPSEEDENFITISHNFSFTNNSVLNEIPDEQFPLVINWLVKKRVSGSSATEIVHKKIFYILKDPGVNTGYFLSRDPNTLLPPDPANDYYNYFSVTLTKQEVKDIKDGNGRLYSAFYTKHLKIGEGNNSTIQLSLHPDQAGNGYTFSNISLGSPFMVASPTFFGLTYRGWGQFLYNGGLKVIRDEEGNITSTPVNYGNELIDASIFDNDEDTNVPDDIDPNMDPDDVELNNDGIRYVSYEQDNGNDEFTNKAIIDSRYGLTSAGRLTATVGRFAESNLHSIYVDPSQITQAGNGVFVGVKIRSVSKGSSESGNLSIPGVGGLSGTSSEANSTIINQYVDLNGDRYPDIVTSSGNIQFTNMLGGLSETESLGAFAQGDESKDRVQGVSIAGLVPDSTESANGQSTGNKTNTNIGSGINHSEGESYNSKQWTDINGDGLQDKIFIKKGSSGDPSSIEVNLNTGYGFTETIVWGSGYGTLLMSERENNSVGVNISFSSSFAAGFGAAGSEADVNAALMDVNGDGLADLVKKTSSSTYKYYLNTGTGFEATPKTFFTASQASAGRNYSISGNIYASGTYGYPFFLPFFIPIPVKVVATGSKGFSATFSETRTTVQDLDGDGLCDLLYKDSNNNSDLTAYMNIVGKTHLLKQVNTPMGGYWKIDYARNGNTYDLPQNKWTVTRIETNDNFTDDNDYKPGQTLTTAVYNNPKYDRREREFLGYGEVTTEQRTPGSEDIYRKVVTSYHNENYYLSGAVKQTAMYDQADNLLSKNETLYNLLDPDDPEVNMQAQNNFLQADLTGQAEALLDKSRLFTAVARVSSTTYENGQGLTAIKEFKEYDRHGNLLTYVDYGTGGNDAYKASISYYDPAVYSNFQNLDNAEGFPEEIEVRNNVTNQLYRNRVAHYNNKGKISSLVTLLNINNDENEVEFSYDVYGNLNSVAYLDNLNASGNHFVKNIVYDNLLRMYPIEVNNSFGESSTIVYNYLFGAPVFTTDVNGESMRTRIDNRGRIVEVTGPNEMALEGVNGNSSAWTIRMDYKGQQTVPNGLPANTYMITGDGSFEPAAITSGDAEHYAITRHFDPEYAATGSTTTSNQLLTISIVDGFGQPIQVKKTHKSNTLKWLVSGFEMKDAFGRTTKSYLTTTENSYPNLSTAVQYLDYSPSSFPYPPVEMEYDAKDRAIEIKQPGENQSSVITYDIEDGMFSQSIINELAQTAKVFTDIRGRKRKTIQNDEIVTMYEYNTINELTKVISDIDNGSFITGYKYDLAGRKIEMQHPDRGVVTFTYDNAGRMTGQSNSNLLLNGGQQIVYNYDFSRLTSVEYPNVPQNNVTYTYGAPGDTFAESENAVGRLLYQEDASGVQVFGYGHMGEVTKNLRSVAVGGYNSYWFFTQWKYDSWNRVQEIVYPDQETVSYHYNTAGMLTSIDSQINNISNLQPIISSIKYTDYGERSEIEHGNGVVTTYNYDDRRRMNNLAHGFANFDIDKTYEYDVLSNITKIKGTVAQSGGSALHLGGPVEHNYIYDDYNRLKHADGYYVGPNDLATPFLRQEYTLDMEYNNDHTIRKKTQTQIQGDVTTYTDALTNSIPVYKNSYVLDYNYDIDPTQALTVTGTSGEYGYLQPHAVRGITDSPGWVTNPDADDPRIRHKNIKYDANGNQLEITETVGEETISLRQNLWDEENRLRAVNLKPDDETNHPVAIYTYDAGGERTVRYNYDRTDVSSNGKEVGEAVKDNVMIYPSGLLLGKPLKNTKREGIFTYTKHYYIGSERVSAKTGTSRDVGYYPSQHLQTHMPNLTAAMVRPASNSSVTDAETVIVGIYSEFDLPAPPVLDSEVEDMNSGYSHNADLLNTYYIHSDHLGSSSYITDAAQVVTQHMEYLPYGETMVEEHSNSNNSPFMYNGKEYDEETGNYYYGARYYDPKLSIFISVDPLAEKYSGWSSYCYTLNNPLKYIDPDGKRVYFIPGLGHDRCNPSTYVLSMVKAYGLDMDDYGDASSKEFKLVNGGSKGYFGDMAHVWWRGSFPTMNYMSSGRIHNAAQSIAAGIKEDYNEPISVVGASQGSVTSAQATIQLLEHWEEYGLEEQPTIENLVLVGSPIQKGSALWNKLQEYKERGLIKNLEYDDFQASADGKFDFITGLAGFSPIDGLIRGIGSFIGMMGRAIFGKDYHVNMAGDKNFGDMMREKFNNNLQGNDKENGDPQPIR